MVIDDTGRRLIATHTTKGSKRYRYYWNRQPGQESKTHDDSACACQRTMSTYCDEQWLELLNAADLDTQLRVDESAASAYLRSSAAHLAKGWTALSAIKQRENS